MTQIVTDASGQKHEFPDAATPQQIIAALGGKREKGNITDAIISAATFGLSDEAKALGSATGDLLARQFGMKKDGSFGADYERALATERAKLADLSLAEKISGGAIGGLVNAPAAGALKLAQLIKQGALIGGAYGFGEGEGGAVNRLESAAGGAAAGGAIGAAVPAAVSGVGKLAQTITNPEKASSRRAAQVIEKALTREGVTPGELAQRMAAAPEGTTVAEAGGEPTQRLARAVAATPGESGKRAAEVLGERSAQMGEDITRAARGSLGDVNAYGALDSIAARQKAAAAPLYESAYQQPMPFTGELESIINKPATRKALRQAEEIAANEGDNIPQWFVSLGEKDGKITADDIKEVPSTRVWHYVRQALDDQLEKYRSPVSGKLELDTAGRAIAGIRNDLSQQMRSLNPQLAQADDIFSGLARAKDALSKGRDFMKRRPEEIDKQISSMTDSERQFFRLGVAQAIDNRMSDVARGNSAVSRLADVPSFEAKVRSIFPDDASAQSFIDLLNAKREQQGFKNMVLSGSRTTPLAQDIADLGTSRLETAIDAARAATGDRGALGRLAMRTADRWRAGFSEDTRNKIGEVLFSQKMPDITNVAPEPAVNPAVRQAVTASGAAAGAESLQGGEPPPAAPVIAAPEVGPQPPPSPASPSIDSILQKYRSPQPIASGPSPDHPGDAIENILDKYRTTPLDRLSDAIMQQESGGRNVVSPAGARGPMQIMPTTWHQYAQPGEYIDNPEHNVRVGKRIVADLYQRYRDPRAVAAAYFSGKPDFTSQKTDGTGKTVAGYVNDVMSRIQGQAA